MSILWHIYLSDSREDFQLGATWENFCWGRSGWSRVSFFLCKIKFILYSFVLYYL